MTACTLIWELTKRTPNIKERSQVKPQLSANCRPTTGPMTATRPEIMGGQVSFALNSSTLVRTALPCKEAWKGGSPLSEGWVYEEKKVKNSAIIAREICARSDGVVRLRVVRRYLTVTACKPIDRSQARASPMNWASMRYAGGSSTAGPTQYFVFCGKRIKLLSQADSLLSLSGLC